VCALGHLLGLITLDVVRNAEKLWSASLKSQVHHLALHGALNARAHSGTPLWKHRAACWLAVMTITVGMVACLGGNVLLGLPVMVQRDSSGLAVLLDRSAVLASDVAGCETKIATTAVRSQEQPGFQDGTAFPFVYAAAGYWESMTLERAFLAGAGWRDVIWAMLRVGHCALLDTLVAQQGSIFVARLQMLSLDDFLRGCDRLSVWSCSLAHS
jgi:hypothetical protein